jgi:hypothetical protein
MIKIESPHTKQRRFDPQVCGGEKSFQLSPQQAHALHRHLDSRFDETISSKELAQELEPLEIYSI